MTKRKLLQVLLAEEPEIGCTCPDCDSTISWTLARGYLDFALFTTAKAADREAEIERFWQGAIGPLGPKIWPTV
jgi:hypothetical protein